MPDAVVIGAGPNGLVAANLLADRGWSVTVVEASSEPGGAVRSAELMEPGFVNDVFSAFYPLAVASPAIRNLKLEEFGLRWCRAPVVLAHPGRDALCPILSTDLDETAASLDACCPGDGDAWRRLFDRWTRLRDPLLAALFTPTPPITASARLAVSAWSDGWTRVARFALLSVRRMGEEEFGSDAARRLLAGSALHADLSPEAVLSGFFAWMLCALGQEVGWPVPEGGSGRLTAALVDRLRSRGGEVVCDAPVDRIVIRDRRAVAVRVRGDEIRATRAVLADVAAPSLYLDLVGAEHLPARVVEDVRRFEWDNATVKVDWNLDSPIPWTSEPARRAGTLHLADGVDGLSESSSALARGLVPARPFLVMGQQSMTDPTRMPAGAETVWAYTHVPREIRGDAAGVLDLPLDRAGLERIADRMQAEIECLAPGFGASVRGRHVMGPADLEARNANLAGGAIGAGTSQLYQQLVFRPVPGLGRPETPIRGLYLASASAHPGGGVHGACGANAARVAVGHDRIRRVLYR
ncbi:MAG TPA: NAD(P)/FAD-dependent oxidoreductase [Acidimicrobiia bacterium]|nr:NAD(P)/FAD-dependent oxidoreductase [Acidimicrobiia bacterium]